MSTPGTRRLLSSGLASVLVAALLGLAPRAASGAPPAPNVSSFVVPTAGSRPTAITPGPDGNLWFTESVPGGRIGRITPAGAITEFPTATGGVPRHIAAGPDGNLWFTVSPNSIGRITPAGAVTEFGIVPESWTPVLEPWGITAGPDGNLWFTLFNAIGRITPAGVVRLFPGPPPPGLSVTLRAGSEITTGSDGNLWFIESSAGLGRITPGGVMSVFPVPVASPRLPIQNITAGPDGNLWVSWVAIARVTPTGLATAFRLPTNLSPGPLVVGPDGHLWFASAGGVGEYSVPALTSITTTGLTTAVFTPLPGVASDIAAGPDSNLWLVLPERDEILRVAPRPPFVAISPGSGTYLPAQEVDVVITVNLLAVPAVGGQATLDGVDVSAALAACGIRGRLLGGGHTLRCPGLTGASLGPGAHRLTVTLEFADGSTLSDAVVWEVPAPVEP